MGKFRCRADADGWLWGSCWQLRSFSRRRLFAQTAQPPHRPPRTTSPIRPRSQLVLPPLPSGPLSQLPMDQIPPTPAKVSYQGGLLTISAQNSTLGEILRDVRKLTGASIEIPQNSGATSEWSRTSVRERRGMFWRDCSTVPSFNYVMLGSSSDPTAVSSVILTAKPSVGEDRDADCRERVSEQSGARCLRTAFPSLCRSDRRRPQPGIGNRRVPKPTTAARRRVAR